MDSSPQSFELEELKQAFHMLTSVSEKMESSYERLKGQAEELKQELFEKNARLLVSLQERQRLEGFLEGILQNLPVGILVTDKEGRVRLANQMARDALDRSQNDLAGVKYTAFEILRQIPLRSGGVAREEEGQVRIQLLRLLFERVRGGGG